ncbi:MAG TPA: glycosyltransferase [Gaiellaceae bacterium]|nr:glycosyltransferase [Gaiellaceae bacterium]
MAAPALRYAVVTPVRNEAVNLRRVFASLAGQSVRPESWILVDTGSTDGTVDLARALAREQPWIDFIAQADSGTTKRGGPIVRGFEAGVSRLDSVPDVIVKLDADVSMGSGYFERLLEAFAANPKLGIASGSAQELEGGGWRMRHNTGASVWGAARAYRAECLADVRPLEEQMGWDGIDELKARVRGWTTETIVDLPFRHHRAEGARDGSPWKAWTARGRASHYMGYRAWYLIARTLHHARSERAALGMVWGYALAIVTRQPVCSDEAVRGRLRQEQSLRNLRARRREALGASGR